MSQPSHLTTYQSAAPAIASTASPVVSLRNITKKYHGHIAAHVDQLDVYPSQMVAITGPSGSGKTTLLNIVGLLETADSGTVQLFGTPAPGIGSKRARQLLRSQIGYLFQNFALLDGETVAQNLSIATRYAGVNADEFATALQTVGLAGMKNRHVYELSGGEQQRVAVARLMLKPCQLILADEPTGSLDSGSRDTVLNLLRQLAKSGKTVIIVTHDPVVAGACDRTIALRNDE